MNSGDTRDAAFKRALEVICGALLGVSIISTLQLASLALDLPLTGAVYCFAVSTPILCFAFIRISLSHKKWTNYREHEAVVLTSVGILLSLVGLAAIIYHLSTGAGIVFAALSFLGILRTAFWDW
ncbi:MAG TPA: hypothetical protein VEM96_03625 [Pyrinomonadaceae bacterium]|nr:hypothetical protein [Pyrinomonadaceae bacterium]